MSESSASAGLLSAPTLAGYSDIDNRRSYSPARYVYPPREVYAVKRTLSGSSTDAPRWLEIKIHPHSPPKKLSFDTFSHICTPLVPNRIKVKSSWAKSLTFVV